MDLNPEKILDCALIAVALMLALRGCVVLSWRFKEWRYFRKAGNTLRTPLTAPNDTRVTAAMYSESIHDIF